jgi:hypothetical protein
MMNHEYKWDEAALNLVWQSPPSDALVLLLVRDMCLIADDHGRAPLLTLATRFRNFFRKRVQEGKAELDVTGAASLGINEPWREQSIEWWSATIASRILPNIYRDWLTCDGNDVSWSPELWAGWSPGFRKALRNAAEIRLIQYFETRVEGGW